LFLVASQFNFARFYSTGRDAALELFCKSSDEKIAAASTERACDNTMSVWLPVAKTLECELGLA
jgi:hypothetical protein